MFPKWVFLGAEETVPVGFCSFILSSGYMPLHLDLFLTFIFHSSELVQGWCSGWLVPSRPSPSLLSDARGVMGRRKAKEREDFLPFSFPPPPAPAARITWRQLGTSQVQWWHTCLPLMWPRFKSRCRFHMWVEFVVSSLLCSKRFFSGYSDFPLSLKTNTSKFHFDLECRDIFKRVLKDS